MFGFTELLLGDFTVRKTKESSPENFGIFIGLKLRFYRWTDENK